MSYRWLDRGEAADWARVSLRTLDTWLEHGDGRLKSVQVGRRRLIRSDWLDAFLEGRSPPHGGEQKPLGD